MKIFKFKSVKAAEEYSARNKTNTQFVVWLVDLIKDYDVTKAKFALIPDDTFDEFVGKTAFCLGQEFKPKIRCNLFSPREIKEYLDEIDDNQDDFEGGNVNDDPSKIVEVSKKITTVLNIQGEFTKSELNDIVARLKLAMEKL